MNPFFVTDFSISDSLKTVRKSVLIYETIIKGDSDMLIMLLFLASVLYFILLAVDILKAIVRSFISRNEVKWNRYVLIEIEDLLQTELFKAKEIKKKQKR